MTDHCPSCGASLPHTRDAFCSECHSPLDTGSEKPEVESLSCAEESRPVSFAARIRTLNVKLGILLGLAVIVGLVWLLVTHDSKKGKQANTAEIRKQAIALSEATAGEDYETVVDMTYSKVVEEMGGRKKAIAAIKAIM